MREFEDGTFRFVTGSEVLYIKELSSKYFEISCSDETWNRTWIPYFDLERNYFHVRETIPGSDIYICSWLRGKDTESGYSIKIHGKH